VIAATVFRASYGPATVETVYRDRYGENAATRAATVLLAIFVSLFPALSAATTPAEIDRLRMHADSGRDGQALHALRAAAGTGSVDAQRAAGGALLNSNDPTHATEGIQWLTAAANQNDARAMILLGKAYLFGLPASGRAADTREARTWFKRADPARNPQAAYYLGIMDKSGYGQPANPVSAVARFRFAAQHNLPDAMYLLGNAYANGEGVDADPREAMRWYLRAAAFDHPLATQELAQAFARGDTLLPQSELQAGNMRRAVEHALRHPAAAP
jgi:uncharacterized protein